MAKWNKKKPKTQKKDTLVDQIRTNDEFEKILSLAKTEQEKRFIKAYAEQLLKNCQVVIDALKKEIEKDPDAVKRIMSELLEIFLLSL